jgi:glycosyltransferase involved in cell wall biosynthesis
MKIALISFLFEPEIGGGAAIAARSLADGLTTEGFQVTVITTHAQPSISVERVGNLTIFRFFPWNFYWVGNKDRQPMWKRVFWQLIDIWNPFSFRVVRSILAQEQPDIVHVHKLRGLSPSIWPAARSAGIDTIIQTCHDYELISPEGTLSGRVGSWAQRRAGFLRPYQQVRARLSNTLAVATAPSRYVLDTHSRAGFFKYACKYVVPNSHDLTQKQLDFQHSRSRSKQVIKNKALRLLYLGRLERIKGVDILCAAFERCVARFPDLHLDIVGWGTLENVLLQRYGNHPQITFYGPLFGESKSRMLETSDVLVVPSVWPETFAIVIVEAYARGVPVIATHSGGIPELVEEGQTGFLVPPGDITALAEAICRVAANPDTVQQMSAACLEMGRRFTPELVNKTFLSIYESACLDQQGVTI